MASQCAVREPSENDQNIIKNYGELWRKFSFRFMPFIKYSHMAKNTSTVRCPIPLDSQKPRFEIKKKEKEILHPT
jgi:hypothetical protein